MGAVAATFGQGEPERECRKRDREMLLVLGEETRDGLVLSTFV